MPETMSDWDEPENFEQLIEYLYKNFPNGMLKDRVLDGIIVSESEREKLVEHGYLNRELHADEKGEDFHYYSLGPNGLQLVSTWRTEELTKKMAFLTKVIVALTVLSILASLTPVLVS